MPLFWKDEPTTKKICTGFECSMCKTRFSADDTVAMQEMIHISHDCGYGSVFGDGARVEVTLCQGCAKSLFEDFATFHDV